MGCLSAHSPIQLALDGYTKLGLNDGRNMLSVLACPSVQRTRATWSTSMEGSPPWSFPIVASLGADCSARVTSERLRSDRATAFGATSRVPASICSVVHHSTRPTSSSYFGTLVQAFVTRWSFSNALAIVEIRAESLSISQCICGCAWLQQLHRTAG